MIATTASVNMIRVSSISENPGLLAISEMIGFSLGDTICIDAGAWSKISLQLPFSPMCVFAR